MKMNLHQLKIFYETAQNENLSKTAEKYHPPEELFGNFLCTFWAVNYGKRRRQFCLRRIYFSHPTYGFPHTGPFPYYSGAGHWRCFRRPGWRNKPAG